MSKTFICTNCREICKVGELCEVGEDQLCTSCADELTVNCERCGERIYIEDNAGNDDISLCVQCCENHYLNCDSCHRLITMDQAYNPDDEDAAYCYDCYLTKQENDNIHEYGYKPEPIFYGTGDRYFGVELELDEGGKDGNNAEKLTDLANRAAEHIYIKSDSSLEDGLEIVTHPMSLDYHLHQMPWKALMEMAIDLDYLSHRTSTCGLHIHVNRTTFGETTARQEDCIGRVLYFVEHHWAELLRFSRRTEDQLRRWAARYGYKDKPKDILDSAKKSYGGRYTCVNLHNYDTIEFRIFRGTLKYNTLAATLQLVNEICNVAFLLSDEELAILSWSGFVERLDKIVYPELIQYLKERRLYINEPVTVEEDD